MNLTWMLDQEKKFSFTVKDIGGTPSEIFVKTYRLDNNILSVLGDLGGSVS